MTTGLPKVETGHCLRAQPGTAVQHQQERQSLGGIDLVLTPGNIDGRRVVVTGPISNPVVDVAGDSIDIRHFVAVAQGVAEACVLRVVAFECEQPLFHNSAASGTRSLWAERVGFLLSGAYGTRAARFAITKPAFSPG